MPSVISSSKCYYYYHAVSTFTQPLLWACLYLFECKNITLKCRKKSFIQNIWICDTIKGNESHVKDFQFWDFYNTIITRPIRRPFWCKPHRIGYSYINEPIYQCRKNIKLIIWSLSLPNISTYYFLLWSTTVN